MNALAPSSELIVDSFAGGGDSRLKPPPEGGGAATAQLRPVNRSGEELAMRALVAARMRDLWPSARIIHELPLRYSARRIDVAAVTEDDIFCAEIKSSRDTLDRLEEQLRGFASIASGMIVALAPKHAGREDSGSHDRARRGRPDNARDIIRRVDDTTAVWIADAETGALDASHAPWRFYTRRPWTARMLDMLHNVELEDIAYRHRCLARGSKPPNHESLVTACEDLMGGREIRRAVCAALRTRDAFDKQSDPPIAADGPKTIAAPPKQEGLDL
jgi:hypothetical protein